MALHHASERLVIANRRCRELYGVPQAGIRPLPVGQIGAILAGRAALPAITASA